MNYDTFEREVLGYARRIDSRTEHMRARHTAAPARVRAARRPAPRSGMVRLRVALALRHFADRLDASAAHPV